MFNRIIKWDWISYGLIPFASSIAKCNTWGSRKVYASLSVYAKTIQTFIPSQT